MRCRYSSAIFRKNATERMAENNKIRGPVRCPGASVAELFETRSLEDQRQIDANHVHPLIRTLSVKIIVPRQFPDVVVLMQRGGNCA